MALTTRGKVTLTLRLAAIALVLWGLIVLQRTYAAASQFQMVRSALETSNGAVREMRGMFGDVLAAYAPDYTPGLILIAIGVALFALCRLLVHATFAGVEERPAAES